MIEKVDTYVADTCGTQDAETLKRLRIPLLPDAENFLQIGDVRRLAEEFRLRVYAVTSLGTWRMGDQYLGIDGSLGEIGETNPEEFFHQINNARFELAEKEETTPEGELWYAKLGGHFPEKLVPYLKEHANLFNGVKIGAFVPRELDFTDPKYNELWEFCAEKTWPVLIHCSQSNSETFFQIVELARKYPNARFCASHLGGEKREFIETRSDQISQMANGLPENFFLNIAVRDPSLVRILQGKNPDILKRIVYATDVPFMGSYGEVHDRNQEFFTEAELDTIMANGKRFLLGESREETLG